MTKLLISKATEAKAIASIWNMAGESLDPDNYGNLVEALKRLCKTRNINNEFMAEEHRILSGSREHNSDCKTSDAPAFIPEPCGCSRYSMSAGIADQYQAEAQACRKALGFEANSDCVSPSDLTSAISKLTP